MRKVILFMMMFCWVSMAFAGVSTTKKGVEFFYEAPNAGTVSVAGEFNEWNTSANVMKLGDDGVWRIVIPLSPGSYMYKFVVDGNWVTDPDNPKQKDDGYGGMNSLVEVTAGGELIVNSEPVKQEGISTLLNPKVLFDGRMYSQNLFNKKDYNDKLMLDKPLFDINLGVKVKFNSQVEGYTVMNINNIAEGVDMWKSHLNFKRSYLKLDTQYFLVQAFDKYGFLTFDDPLHLVGDIGCRRYNFGYDVMGIYGRSNLPVFTLPIADIPMQFQAEGVFADNAGDDDTDISAFRGKVLFDVIPETTSLRFGFGEYHAQLPVSTTSSKEHTSNEFDMQASYFMDQPGWQGPLECILSGEYYQFKDTDNENMDSLKTTFAKGDRIFAGLEVKFPAALKIFAHFQRNKLEFARDIAKNQLTLGGEFSTDKLVAKVAMSTWKTDFPDSLVTWNDYFVYMEKTDGNGRWFQKYTNVPYAQYSLMGYETAMYWDIFLGYDFELLNQKFHAGYEGKIAQQDIKYEPKLIENIASLQWDISPFWTLYTDVRVPIYNDPFLQVKTDFSEWKDVFWCNFTSLTYHLSRSIDLSLYWGVNPVALSDVTDEFMPIGRFEYINQIGNFENYLENSYTGLGEKIREAEKSLTEKKRIGVEAVLRF